MQFLLLFEKRYIQKCKQKYIAIKLLSENGFNYILNTNITVHFVSAIHLSDSKISKIFINRRIFDAKICAPIN